VLPTVHPALVITDLMMPLVDGLTLCRAMQAEPAYQAIPIILMSATAEPQATEGCQYAAFLKKPFDLQVVMSTITRLLGLGNQASG
jgi:CheY-like chemotaxis protein